LNEDDARAVAAYINTLPRGDATQMAPSSP
jgi:hypothetical protein